jgi:hypothetical protein
MPDKIKAVQDVMMEIIRKKAAQISPEKHIMGAWLAAGGRRQHCEPEDMGQARLALYERAGGTACR